MAHPITVSANSLFITMAAYTARGAPLVSAASDSAAGF